MGFDAVRSSSAPSDFFLLSKAVVKRFGERFQDVREENIPVR